MNIKKTRSGVSVNLECRANGNPSPTGWHDLINSYLYQINFVCICIGVRYTSDYKQKHSKFWVDLRFLHTNTYITFCSDLDQRRGGPNLFAGDNLIPFFVGNFWPF